MPAKSEAISATIPQMVVQSAIDLIALQRTSSDPGTRELRYQCNKGTASIAGVLGAQPKLIPPCEIPKVVLLDWMQRQRSWSKIEDSQEKVAERQHAQVFIATE